MTDFLTELVVYFAKEVYNCEVFGCYFAKRLTVWGGCADGIERKQKSLVFKSRKDKNTYKE